MQWMSLNGITDKRINWLMESKLFKLTITKLPSHLYNKRVRPTKNEPQQQGISYREREREGVRERRAARQVSRQAYLS